jgi:hypothetical protein
MRKILADFMPKEDATIHAGVARNPQSIPPNQCAVARIRHDKRLLEFVKQVLAYYEYCEPSEELLLSPVEKEFLAAGREAVRRSEAGAYRGLPRSLKDWLRR